MIHLVATSQETLGRAQYGLAHYDSAFTLLCFCGQLWYVEHIERKLYIVIVGERIVEGCPTIFCVFDTFTTPPSLQIQAKITLQVARCLSCWPPICSYEQQSQRGPRNQYA